MKRKERQRFFTAGAAAAAVDDNDDYDISSVATYDVMDKICLCRKQTDPQNEWTNDHLLLGQWVM